MTDFNNYKTTLYVRFFGSLTTLSQLKNLGVLIFGRIENNVRVSHNVLLDTQVSLLPALHKSVMSPFSHPRLLRKVCLHLPLDTKSHPRMF